MEGSDRDKTSPTDSSPPFQTIPQNFSYDEEQEEEPAYVSHSPTSKSYSLEWKLLAGFVILVAVLVGGYLAVFKNRVPDPAPVVTASGLKYSDLKVGDGPTPRLGQRVQVHYVGWLANGTEFNNSYKLGRPAEFSLGPALIPGWNEGLQSMKVGGKRRLIVPPALAYGQRGRPPIIPPNETLTFEIELLAVN